LQLGEAGALVYITGRQAHLSLQSDQSDLPTLQKTADEITERGGKGYSLFLSLWCLWPLSVQYNKL
uniref:Transcriptional regulator n=1 Tax=Gongylonema pulchrum TaxID=637853 RepID=A0A183EMY5_9BILA